ncbi:MAG: hypothetical protein ACP5QG_05730 [candidate division WOR-3 bacterium]
MLRKVFLYVRNTRDYPHSSLAGTTTELFIHELAPGLKGYENRYRETPDKVVITYSFEPGAPCPREQDSKRDP